MSRCVKCGNEKINTVYHKQMDFDEDRGYGACSNKDEHLHKTCQNCQYYWCEDTLDPLIELKEGTE